MRQNPHCEESERTVIGTLLLTGEIGEVAGALRPDEFYHPALGLLYAACLSLGDRKLPVDFASVTSALRESGHEPILTAIGGEEYLHGLAAGIVTTATVGWHAAQVRGKAKRRHLVARLTELRDLGLDPEIPDEQLWQEAEKALLDCQSGTVEQGPIHVKPILREFVRDLEERHARGAEFIGLPTGLRDVDVILSGMQKQDLLVLGARPSMGKTSFALAAIEGAAKAGATCLVFSCEMSAPSLVERLLSAIGPIDGTRLRSGKLERPHWTRLHQACSELAEQPIYIDDTGSISISELRSRARRWRAKAAKGKPALVVVDYIQLVEVEASRGRSREQEVSQVSRSLKAMAKELDCPVMALAQLNRELEKREDKRPQLSDLRDSGAIEQDADVVMFLYRDEVYHEDSKDKGIAEVNIAKQRRGPYGVVRVAWTPSYTRFANLEERR